MAKSSMLTNKFVIPQDRLDFSRSAFKYERTHSTNILTGGIYPVAYVNCMPGTTVPNKFGFILQSAPLLGPSLDNVYIDIVSVWCPTRLVQADFNEWLGDNDTYAWTLGNNVALPRITKVYTGKDSSGSLQRTPTYLAEHFIGPHVGFRYFATTTGGTNFVNSTGKNSVFHKGISVIPSRMYDCIYNRLFRNENLQNPVLFSKQSGTNLSLDVTNYQDNLGVIRFANKIKTWYSTARISPAIQSVDILGDNNIYSPVGYFADNGHTLTGTSLVPGVGEYASAGWNNLGRKDTFSGGSEQHQIVTQLQGLTVNAFYYSFMLQRYFNKASAGRRPVEFYKNMFGISSSDVVYTDPELLSHKRFKVNISRVISTSNSTDNDGNLQGLGTQGAFSLTSAGGTLFPEFTATEYGMFFVFAIVRTQPSISVGIDKYLGDYDLLSTYLPVFDHIGEEAIDQLELNNGSTTDNNYVFGYQEAWYRYRYQTSDVVGILSHNEPLDYMTFASIYSNIGAINGSIVKEDPHLFDKMLQLPVFYETPNTSSADENGEPYQSERYQWLIQFALAGEIIETMSKDSEPLLFGQRI